MPASKEAIFFIVAEVRGINFKKKLLIENFKLQISCCSSTESYLLAPRRFLILYHSEQIKWKKKTGQRWIESLNQEEKISKQTSNKQAKHEKM